jgi:signal transduction histidine kinase
MNRTPFEQVDVAEEAGVLAPSLIHEIRQPLTGALAGAELLARRLGSVLTSLEDWSLLTAQLDRMEELLRAYQDFIHPERHPTGPFEIKPVIDRAVALQTFRLRKLGPRFSFEPDEPLRGLGLPNALLHAATNLLVNALDAIDAAGATGRLAVRVVRVESEIQVRISDEGTGIPDELREKIFEARFTTKSHGTGLGLAIARRMMAAFAGGIEISPEGDPRRLPWARTEFVLKVPAAGN